MSKKMFSIKKSTNVFSSSENISLVGKVLAFLKWTQKIKQRFCYIYQLQRGDNIAKRPWDIKLKFVMDAQQYKQTRKYNCFNDYLCQFLDKFICHSVFVLILCVDELMQLDGDCFFTSRFFIYHQMLLFYRVR